MSINVAWQDENGNHISEWWDKNGLVSLLIDTAGTDDTTCLRFIDPYGDTIFNQIQIPVLLTELSDIVPTLTEENYLQFIGGSSTKPNLKNIQSNLENLISFIEMLVGKPHTYIKFIGD